MWCSWEGDLPPCQGSPRGVSWPPMVPRARCGCVPKASCANFYSLPLSSWTIPCASPYPRLRRSIDTTPLRPRAFCGVTPVEGAGEWRWRKRLFPRAQHHSYRLSEPRMEKKKKKRRRWGNKNKKKKKEGEKKIGKISWEKSCGVQALFAFWLEVWSR